MCSDPNLPVIDGKKMFWIRLNGNGTWELQDGIGNVQAIVCREIPDINGENSFRGFFPENPEGAVAKGDLHITKNMVERALSKKLKSRLSIKYRSRP